MDVSKSLRICLIETGIKKKELAEHLAVTPQAVWLISNKKTCSGTMLMKLSSLFGLKVSEFVALGEKNLLGGANAIDN